MCVAVFVVCRAGGNAQRRVRQSGQNDPSSVGCVWLCGCDLDGVCFVLISFPSHTRSSQA